MRQVVTDWLTEPNGIASRLRASRLASGYSAKQLASTLGWQASKVSRIENGKQLPTADEIRVYMAACGGSEVNAESIVERLSTLPYDRSTGEQRVYTTKSGRVLTESDIEMMVVEAEDGYDVEEMARRLGRPLLGSGPALVVAVRMPPELKAAVAQRAEAESTSFSEIVRTALWVWLAG